MSPFLVLPRVLAKPLRWPIDSVRQARHNAYAATTALAARRAEREDVDQFLKGREPGKQAIALPPQRHLPLPHIQPHIGQETQQRAGSGSATR